MKRLLLAFVACMALFAVPANAAVPTQTITVLNHTYLDHAQLARVERALVEQSHQLRAKWDTPIVRFGAGGWEMDLLPASRPLLTQNNALGWHSFSSTGPYDPYPAGVELPYAYVGVTPGGGWWSVVWSHELMEMLVDPNVDYYIHNRLVEVCDPLENGWGYTIDGVSVASFVSPDYFFRPQTCSQAFGLAVIASSGPNATIAFVSVFESIAWDLNALIGQTLVQQWDFFQDDALTVPFDLTGYTFSAVLKIPNLGENPPVTLTEGNGLTVVANPGSVALSAATAAWPAGRGRWYLQATDPTGEVSFPLRGLLSVGNP